jgi:hypothetical protein
MAKVVDLHLGGGEHLSRADAAKRAGCSVRHLERLALEGGGPPYVKHGRKCAYPVGALDAWLASLLVTSTSAATMRDAGEAA